MNIIVDVTACFIQKRKDTALLYKLLLNFVFFIILTQTRK